MDLDTLTMFRCSRCKEHLPVETQAKSNNWEVCKPCYNQYNRSYRERNKARVRTHHERSRLKAQYGISPEEYDRLFQDQGGKCAICSMEPSDRKLSVDHCHSTNKVRGLLCSNCNSAIGLLQEDLTLFEKAAIYLMGGV